MGNMPVKIAVDVGYGYTKAVADNGKSVIFPSMVAPASLNLIEGCGVYQSVPEYHIKFRSSFITIDKFIGEEAAESSGCVKPAGNEKNAETHDSLLLGAVGLLLEESPEKINIDLGVGLPLAFYKNQKENLTARLSKMAGKLQVVGLKEHEIAVSSVLVFPQGLGAIIASNVSIPKDGYIGIIDIGTHTTDFLMFSCKNSEMRPVFDKCRSMTVGIEQLYKSLEKEFIQQTGDILPLARQHWVLTKTQQGGMIPYRGKQIDLVPALQEAKNTVAEMIINGIQTNWDENVQFAETVFLAGGGTQIFADLMKKTFPNVFPVPDPVFANSRGFLKLVEKRMQVIKTPEISRNTSQA